MKRIFCALLAGALTLGAALPVQAADKAVLRVAADAKQTAISDHLYGAFIEDISYACDGGLVSNLVTTASPLSLPLGATVSTPSSEEYQLAP